MSRCPWRLAVWIGIGLIQTSSAGITEDLAKLRQVYESELTKISVQYSETRLFEDYTNAVVSAMIKAQVAGDLATLVEARKELDRARQEISIPNARATALSEPLAVTQTLFRNRRDQLNTERSGRVIRLTELYQTRLSNMVKALVKANQVDDAMAVQTEIDRILTSETVVAAAATQALVATTATSVATPAALSGPPERTFRSRKDVPAAGTKPDPWTLTALGIEKGDRVTITARGTWKCLYGQVLGPAGGSYGNYSSTHRVVRTGPDNVTTSTYTYASSSSYVNSYAQYPDIAYGALVARIGNNGRVRAVGERLSFVSDEKGFICFGCNVREHWDTRKLCSGTIAVEVEVARGGPSQVASNQ